MGQSVTKANQMLAQDNQATTVTHKFGCPLLKKRCRLKDNENNSICGYLRSIPSPRASRRLMRSFTVELEPTIVAAQALLNGWGT